MKTTAVFLLLVMSHLVTKKYNIRSVLPYSIKTVFTKQNQIKQM